MFAMPLIFGGFAYVQQYVQERQTADMRYAMFGKEHAPGWRALRQGKTCAKSLASPDEIKPRHRRRAHQVRAGDPARPQRPAQRAAGKVSCTTTAPLHRPDAQARARNRRAKRELREHALSALKLNQQQLAFALDPITLEDHSTADKREQMGAIVGGMLPYVLLMVCLMAAMYPAIDLAPAKGARHAGNPAAGARVAHRHRAGQVPDAVHRRPDLGRC
jgi:sodium transport system permease protein